MSLLVPNASKKTMLEMILLAGNVTLCLYTNNKTPALGDVTASYTEASGNGYAAITLTPGNWTITSANPASASYPQQTFAFSGALGNVYGYFVKRASDGLLLWGELFASGGPYNIASSADDIKITPVFTGQ